MKRLDLKDGFRCSYHYHKHKDETFVIEHGKVVLEYQEPWEQKSNIIFMGFNDKIRIHPETYHRFWGLHDSRILEVSTTHFEEDSFRDPNRLSGSFTIAEFNNYMEEHNATKE